MGFEPEFGYLIPTRDFRAVRHYGLIQARGWMKRMGSKKDGGGALRFADLFCGCGGLALGFRKAGFESVFAVDMDEDSCATYERNFGHPVRCGDIADVEELPRGVDVIVGGPPCQGFSLLGKMTPSEVRAGEHLSMNKLWTQYFRLLEGCMPRAFVIENVPQILRSAEFRLIAAKAESLGYSITADVLKAENYEVPQLRRRAFIIGVRNGTPLLPAPSKKRLTVMDAIGDLPPKPNGVNWHIGRNPTAISLERYECVPPGGNRFDLMRKRPDLTPRCWLNKPSGSTDVFGRMKWDAPAFTIRTEFFKPEKGCYLHPGEDRPITHREAARLQTFPDDFEFVGGKTSVARMIGNAVPPMLAYHVAKTLRTSLEKI